LLVIVVSPIHRGIGRGNNLLDGEFTMAAKKRGAKKAAKKGGRKTAKKAGRKAAKKRI
jgi:hypothetical protein